MAAIEIRALHKSFGTKQVLRGIDLAVEPGQIFGYIGPNGSGKTTTVKILIGMQAVFDGEVFVSGLDVRKRVEAVKRTIGYVPENAVLYEALTCFEFLQLVGRLHSMPEVVLDVRIPSLLDAFELDGRVHSRLSSLSKGMRQKVLICSALIHDPAILFLDEPLSGLDVGSTIMMKELLRTLADQGKTIFYCSHLMDVVERVCDRIAILQAGKIVAEGTFEELSESSSGGSLESVFEELTSDGGVASRVQAVLKSLQAGS